MLRKFCTRLIKKWKRMRNNIGKYDKKALFLQKLDAYPDAKHYKLLKKYYKKQTFYIRHKLIVFIKKLAHKRIKSKYLSLARWLFIDLLRGRKKREFGIYQYIALPGEGKTMSMVAHMERFREKKLKERKDFVIATNFNYVHQSYAIEHWLDIVTIANMCYKKHVPVLIAMDEIHVTFDSSEWKDFPAELLAVLSFVRKYGLQFLVSAQIYERIPKKIRDIANFTVVCKNSFHLDRYFKNYYYEKDSYEMQFEDTKGKPKKAKFIRTFVAGDDFYDLYNTKAQVDRMVLSAKEEKKRREDASIVLYGRKEE